MLPIQIGYIEIELCVSKYLCFHYILVIEIELDLCLDMPVPPISSLYASNNDDLC
jgi:hypothetical protein